MSRQEPEPYTTVGLYNSAKDLSEWYRRNTGRYGLDTNAHFTEKELFDFIRYIYPKIGQYSDAEMVDNFTMLLIGSRVKGKRLHYVYDDLIANVNTINKRVESMTSRSIVKSGILGALSRITAKGDYDDEPVSKQHSTTQADMAQTMAVYSRTVSDVMARYPSSDNSKYTDRARLVMKWANSVYENPSSSPRAIERANQALENIDQIIHSNVSDRALSEGQFL
jgi:hypothetical protein